jgi:hypothetical protein
VLEEVGQTALAWLLKDRTHTLSDVEVGQTCLFGIVADIVGHTVLELTLTNGRILWQLCRRLERQQQYKE